MVVGDHKRITLVYFIFFAIPLVSAIVAIGYQVSSNKPIPMLLACFMFGAIGVALSQVKLFTDGDKHFLEEQTASGQAVLFFLFLRLLFGGVLACLLYLSLLSGWVSSEFLPTFDCSKLYEGAPFDCAMADYSDLRDFGRVKFKSLRDAGLMLLFAFLAGFFQESTVERLTKVWQRNFNASLPNQEEE